MKIFAMLEKVTKECGAAHGPPVHIGDPLVLGIKVHQIVLIICRIHKLYKFEFVQ
jgi:hypothetical protein